MIGLTIKQVKGIIAQFDKDIADKTISIQTALNSIQGFTHDREIRYLQKLKDVSHELLTAEPLRIQTLKRQFNRIIEPEGFGLNHPAFRDAVLDALDYEKSRKLFYPKYFKKLGIKSCVYCNGQAALSVAREGATITSAGTVRGKFQVDHFLPKNQYPCFSVTLFNLYPVCANCNNIKGIKKVQFFLYQKGPTITSPFKFFLKPGSQARYLLDRKPEKIEIGFQQPPTEIGFENYSTLFDIDGIYHEQVDIAEELILKAEIYTTAYKETLTNTFPGIFKDEEIIDRLITGNYTTEKDIHKRPMAKFMMDISLDVGLINREKPLDNNAE
jgi:5-methylcytosine-specific restriction endonuclease McrA